MDLLFGSAFFQAIIMGWSWLLLVFSLCFGSISASIFLSLMHGYGFSSGEFGFVSCFMGDVLGYYRFETIKLICLWPCVALSGGVLYKFDDVITSLRVWCSLSRAFVLTLEAFVFVLRLLSNL